MEDEDIDPNQQRKPKGKGDIVFLIDATGSMQPGINDIKNNLKVFFDVMDERVEHWRAKVVGFRDFEWDDEPLVDNPFTEDLSVLKKQLESLEAVGGGDEPESLLEGIWYVANMEQTDKGATEFDPKKWRHRSEVARIVIILTDASFHERMEKPEGGTIDDLANACHSNRIILYGFVPEMDCYDNLLCEIDKSDLYLIPFDENDEGGAVMALAEFTGDAENFPLMVTRVSVSAAVECALL